MWQVVFKVGVLRKSSTKLTKRQTTFRDTSYCALAWGARLASRSDDGTAVDLIEGKVDAL